MRTASGVTLLEILLVLTISAIIIIFSIQQIGFYQKDAAINQVRYNVEILFQALNNFYHAECYGTLTPYYPGETFAPGLLNTTSVANFSVTAANLEAYLSVPLKASNIADATPGPNYAYITQFNSQISTRQVCVAGSTNCNTPFAQVLSWTAQVSIQLPSSLSTDTQSALAYLYALEGNCLSQANGDNVTVAPCPSTGVGEVIEGSATYVVFQRSPVVASPNATQDTWIMNPNVTQFTQLYQVNPGTYLLNQTSAAQAQYIYCGN